MKVSDSRNSTSDFYLLTSESSSPQKNFIIAKAETKSIQPQKNYFNYKLWGKGKKFFATIIDAIECKLKIPIRVQPRSSKLFFITQGGFVSP
jgi:hypothetical protein